MNTSLNIVRRGGGGIVIQKVSYNHKNLGPNTQVRNALEELVSVLDNRNLSPSTNIYMGWNQQVGGRLNKQAGKMGTPLVHRQSRRYTQKVGICLAPGSGPGVWGISETVDRRGSDSSSGLSLVPSQTTLLVNNEPLSPLDTSWGINSDRSSLLPKSLLRTPTVLRPVQPGYPLD